jgi:DNA-binding transcriptional MocR family regulator
MDDKGFLYQQLADELGDKIRSGDLGVGEKLPSLRGLHRKLGVSIGTVYQAYTELESKGLVEARPKSGYYVKSAKVLSLPVPGYVKRSSNPSRVHISAILSDVVNASLNPNLVPLGASTLSLDLFPYKHLKRILGGISPMRMKRLIQYPPAEGDPELRRRIAMRLLGIAPHVRPDDVVITNGCMEALSLSMLALTSPGDVVAVESPAFFGALQLFRELGLKAMEVPTNPRYGVDVEALEAVLDRHPVKACLFTPNYHNPLGALMPDDRKQDLVELLNRRGIPLVEDDIYAELHFTPQRPSLLKTYDQKDLVITCSSVSKVLAPGFRVGWLVVGERFRERLSRLKSGFNMATSSIEQYVCSQFLGDGAFDRFLRSLRRTVEKQVHETAVAIQQYFPKGCKLAPPQGGNVLWVELPPKVDGYRLYNSAMENGISIVPGGAFSTTRRYDHYVRISSTAPFDDRIRDGIKILGDLAEREMGAEENKAA